MDNSESFYYKPGVEIITKMSDYHNTDKSKVIHILEIFTKKYEQLIDGTAENTNKIINADLDYVRINMVFYKDENNDMKLVFLLYAQEEQNLINNIDLNYLLNFELSYKNKKSNEIILICPDTGMFPLVYGSYFSEELGGVVTEELMVKAAYSAALAMIEKYKELISK